MLLVRAFDCRQRGHKTAGGYEETGGAGEAVGGATVEQHLAFGQRLHGEAARF
jgi:hypothetical protein